MAYLYKFIAFALISFLLVLVFVLVKMDKNVVVARYHNYEHMLREDAFSHGMAPSFLPKSSADIIAMRDIDANTLVLEFSYGDDFELFLRQQTVAVKFILDEEVRLPPNGFIDLKNNNDIVYIKKTSGVDEYDVGELIVNKTQKRALFLFSLVNSCRIPYDYKAAD